MTRDYDILERAIAQLIRLNSSRKVHARFAAAAGVVLSQPVAVLLRRIAENGPLTMGEAAALTHMDPAATGRQIKELEREGLVTTERSKADGRVTVVRATRRGAEVTRRMARVWQQHMEDVLSRWSKSDREALASLLERFVEDLRSMRYRSLTDEATG
jgi:DNA-binding MarR family transcriptional regulator